MKRVWAAVTAMVLLLGTLLSAASALAASSVTEQTPLGNSAARIHNIQLAAQAINGYYLPYGASFSFNSVVGERTAERGYQSAVNGRGVKVVGGGVAQVASTIYLALQSVGGISYDELETYGSKYNQDYVASSSDAILVDQKSGHDFAFTNYADDMLLEVYTSGDTLYCTLTFGTASSASSSTAGGEIVSSASISLEGTDALFNNVSLAAGAIDGCELSGNGYFSFNDIVGARTAENGYRSAVNGRGVKVVGGGVAQVASAVWLAIKNMDDISIIEKSTYGNRYNQSYVWSASDAILTDYNAGTDFSFRYIGNGSITIRTYVDGALLKCDVYLAGETLAWW